MPSARFPHLEGVGVKEEPADESLQSSAAQPPNLRGSSVATLRRPFPHRAAFTSSNDEEKAAMRMALE